MINTEKKKRQRRNYGENTALKAGSIQKAVTTTFSLPYPIFFHLEYLWRKEFVFKFLISLSI